MTRIRPARISLLLADVDGTLVTRDKVLAERARLPSTRCMRRTSALLSRAAGRPTRAEIAGAPVVPIGRNAPTRTFQ